MRDLLSYATECMEMLDVIGIEYGNITAFKVNTTATGRWGQCRRVSGGYEININVSLLDESNPELALMETIIHELIHSCYGCMNHGDKWKNKVVKVNREYGLHISPTPYSRSREDKAEVVNFIKKNIKHRFVCSKCGAVIERQRESEFTKHPEHYHCAKCGGKFKKEF